MSDLIAYVIDNFRVVGGKLERLVDEVWVDTTTYADQKRIRVNGAMVKREEVMRILEENAQPLEEETAAWSAKAQARLQRQLDINRIERRVFREEARKLNETNSLFQEVLQLLAGQPATSPVLPPTSPEGGVLIVQYTDLHAGETVNLPNNYFNTKVLAQRLSKYTDFAINTGIKLGCTKVVVAITGDVCNSDRRQSELLTNEYNRAKSLVDIYTILSACIERLSCSLKVTDVVSVCANESRIDKDFAFEPRLLTNNFDYIVHEMLRSVWQSSIRFSDWGYPVERILNINGKKILISHGITKSKANPETQVAYYEAKYGTLDLVMTGHVHSPLIAPKFSRSASPVSGNCYSELGIGIPMSVASQTMHIVRDDGVFSIPVNLDNTADTDCFINLPGGIEKVPVVTSGIEINI